MGRERILRATIAALRPFSGDPARPVEFISLFYLLGWLQFLLTKPEVFELPRYQAFAMLPPYGWAAIIASIIVAQLLALRQTPSAGTVRFVAMALATGIWTVIALNFWGSDTAPIAARTNTVTAAAAFVTAVYLGLVRRS